MHTALAARPAARAPRFDVAPDIVREDDAWLTAKLKDAILFETPWEGDRRLIPVRTTRALKDASAVFANRMWERLDWFLDGQEVCFLWTGPEKAAVTLRTDPMFGWTVREIAGRDGRRVSAATETEIVARFAAMGFRCRAV